ncbi:MAG: septal ring lytic transglycosylase RlpA family protein [bacterium]|nr:septal ring lytic transglycosylase RlpA family protein [bacterium]
MPRTSRLAWIAGWVVVVAAACVPASGAGSAAPTSGVGEPGVAVRLPSLAAFEGLASWYGPGFAGRRTASGEVFDPSQLTAAHKTLPFGTRVRVTNLDNGRSVEVRITDRGPFKPNRVIDLSRGAAEAIDMVRSGIAPVRIEPLTPGMGAVRLAVATDLRGFEARSELHPPGRLLLLRSERAPDPVVVRIVGGDVGSGADLFVAPELYLVLGPIVAVRSD